MKGKAKMQITVVVRRTGPSCPGDVATVAIVGVFTDADKAAAALKADQKLWKGYADFASIQIESDVVVDKDVITVR